MNKKLLILSLIIILAGIVVVCLKGFDVDLTYKQHNEIIFRFDSEVNLEDVESICKDVFGNKKVVVKPVELFNDGISINASSITEEEKNSLVEKLNEKYNAEKKAEDTEILTIPKVRIRDWFRAYIKPTIISAFIVIVYIIIKYRKTNSLKILGDVMLRLILTCLVILSIVAIIRVPLRPSYITILVLAIISKCSIYLAKNNNEKVENK